MSTRSVVFDRAVSYYDQTRGFPPGVAADVASLFQVAGHLTLQSQLLEIGIGTGRIALPLSRLVKTYYGVDLSRPMMQRLREKSTGEPIEVAEGDITRLPIAGSSVDAVVAVHIFHLVADWRGALAEVKRVLRPGGVLLLGRNAGQDWMQGIWDALRSITSAQKASPVGVTYDQEDTFPLEEGWRQIGETHRVEYGFEIIPQETVNRVRNRTWSRLWELTGDEIEQCARLVQEKISASFENPQAPARLEERFEVRVFTP